jgi:hypothetical protein
MMRELHWPVHSPVETGGNERWKSMDAVPEHCTDCIHLHQRDVGQSGILMIPEERFGIQTLEIFDRESWDRLEGWEEGGST